MSSFREIQNPVNSGKSNTLVSVIVVLLILIVTLQIWLMYGALNSVVTKNSLFLWAAFGGSVLLFIIGLLLLKYLPGTKIEEVKDPGNPYE